MGWEEFLAPVAAAVRNPPIERDFIARIGVCKVALTDIPLSMLTPQLQREAVRKFEFWPSVAEIGTWLGGMAMAARAERSAIAYDAPQPPRERTEEERAHAAAAARSFAADMQALNRPRAAAPAATRPVSDEHLLAAYEAEAASSPICAMRAEQLRKKLGVVETTT